MCCSKEVKSWKLGVCSTLEDACWRLRGDCRGLRMEGDVVEGRRVFCRGRGVRRWVNEEVVMC